MNAAKVLEDPKRRFPNEPEYHQAVEEVLGTIEEEYNKHPEFDKVNLIERLCIPDRVYQFRVTWMDDKGNVQTNMGYRVQHNNAIGPYKGGIRFHASVNLGILIIGGFHFFRLTTEGEDAATLDKSAAILNEYGATYYTCHCTGTEQYEYLKAQMPKLNYIATGDVIEF